LDEKIARVRREAEEIGLEIIAAKKSDTEIQEWESIIHSLSSENPNKLLTSRIQKLTSSSSQQHQNSSKEVFPLYIFDINNNSLLITQYRILLLKPHNYQLYHLG
jgi:hypothetical protein